MNIYASVKRKSDIESLNGLKLKEGVEFFYSLFFKSPNHSQDYLLQAGKSVVYVQNGLVNSGNLDCIPSDWQQMSIAEFIMAIAA